MPTLILLDLDASLYENGSDGPLRGNGSTPESISTSVPPSAKRESSERGSAAQKRRGREPRRDED